MGAGAGGRFAVRANVGPTELLLMSTAPLGVYQHLVDLLRTVLATGV